MTVDRSSSHRPRTTSDRSPRGSRRPAFSLVELMIGIVILGLGMTMVAIMFPVAWDRARRLNDFTIERTATAAAHATVKSLVPVASLGIINEELMVTSAGFAGDLIFSPINGGLIIANDPQWPSDTWVHALNTQNIQVENRRFVSENPWILEHATDLRDGEWDGHVPDDLLTNSYLTSRIDFHQRVYPPMDRRQDVDADGVFTKPDARWDDSLDSRRFFWAVLHRLREQVGPTFLTPSNERVALADQAKGQSRSFDVYYVLLRRPQSTMRYARQDPTPAATPNPYELSGRVVTVQPLGPELDVMFPVPWRVQVQFPTRAILAPTRAEVVGIPTEITVPPAGVAGEAGRLSVQLFPTGTRFIDEISGEVFRVVQRRVIGALEDEALLTLDREVAAEELDVTQDPRCGGDGDCFPRIRTVWVFPPPVESRGSVGDPLVFTGSSPVIEITIRTLTTAPTN